MADLTPAPASAAAKPTDGSKPRSSRDDVLQFLDSLDEFKAPPDPSATPTDAVADGAPVASDPAAGAAAVNAEDAQSVLDFLEELTQRSSTPTATVKTESSLKRSTSATLGGGAGAAGGAAGRGGRRSGEATRTSAAAPAPAAQEEAQEGGWGWGSVWSQTTNVLQQAGQIAQQARVVAEEQVKAAVAPGGAGIGGLGGGLMKALGENEQAKKWSEGVMEYARGAHLDQIGKDLKTTTLRSLTDLLNAVAPPIAEHEVIQVSLSHDMIGYDGVETLVYRGLAKIMDQVEGGTLIINKGDEEKAKDSADDDPDARNINYVEGLAEGWKMAEANIAELIKHTYKPVDPNDAPSEETLAQSLTVPITNCPIFIRIQPCLAPLPFCLPTSASDSTPTPTSALYFLLLLRDPTNNLSHASMSQSMPAAWLDIPFEENEWVEDVMVEVIRMSVEVIGQEYITKRLRGRTDAINNIREAAQETLAQQAPAAEAKQEVVVETPAPSS